MKSVFTLPETPLVPVQGGAEGVPVHRIFCVGRNYSAHAAEMGVEVDREAPFYFTKSPSALKLTGGETPYPPGTSNFHFEMELVVVIGKPVFRATEAQARDAVYGYACGLDMTRRDLQLAAREKQRPWDLGKDVEQSAVISDVTLAKDMAEIGPQRIALSVNGETKQDAVLSDLIHNVTEVIMHLSGFYHLEPGDLIYTGTPAGVGAVVAGDKIEGVIDGLTPVTLSIGAAE